MWVAVPGIGWLSIVLVDERLVDDPSSLPRVLVRARRRAHLIALQQRYPDLLGGIEVMATPAADYPVRFAPIPRTTWAEILRRLGDELTHTNVKAAFSQNPIDPPEAHRRVMEALNSIWSSLRGIEDQRPPISRPRR